MKNLRIGLFGGSFDPIHNSHLEIAKAASRQLGLDEIWFLIEAHPKTKTPSSYHHRLNMTKLATADYQSFVCDRFEIQKSGTTYNIKVLKEIKKLIPTAEFWLIAGTDTMYSFDKWLNYQEFAQLVQFGVVNRPGFENKFEEFLDNLPIKLNYSIIKYEPKDTSSSNIRSAINPSEHQDILPVVAEYIKRNNLYS